MKAFEIRQKPEGQPLRDSKKPLIAIALARAVSESDTQVTDGLLQSAQRGVEAAGGLVERLSFEGISEGVAWGHGLKYLLPRRDLLADEIECLSLGAGAEGLILVGDSPDMLAGLLMGAVRSRLPGILLPSGFQKNAEVLRGPLKSKNGKPTLNHKGGLFSIDATRQTQVFALIAEGLGVSLPGTSTLPANDPKRFELAYQSGVRAVEMARQNIALYKILGPNAFTNAVRLDASLGGGSVDILLHLLAIAQECGVKLSYETFEKIHRETPQLVDLSRPKNAEGALADLEKAGGVPAILWALKDKLLPSPTVAGKSIGELSKGAGIKDTKVIRLKSPYRKVSGFAILTGNLSPAGAVTNVASLPASRLITAGPVKVFDSEDACFAALKGGRVKKGDILVIRYEGPAGGPGMPPLRKVPALLEALGLIQSVVVITDGRFAGLPQGLLISMASPEALAGGTLALLRDGDRVDINVPNRQLVVRLTDTELKVRTARWKPPAPKAASGFLSRYSRLVTGAHLGAVVKS